MSLDFSDKKSYAVVSDIAANQIDDLYVEGGLSMPTLHDLLEFAQIAVLSNEVLVSPAAYETAHWLNTLNFVKPLEFDVKVKPSDETLPENEFEPEGNDQTIRIDLSEEGHLKSSHPLGELAMALMSFLAVRKAPILGNIADPIARKHYPGPDYRFRQLPTLMLLTQMALNMLSYEDDSLAATKDGLMASIKEAVVLYSQYVFSMDRLSQVWGIDTLTSTLEQPLYNNLQVKNRIQFTDDHKFLKELKKLLSTAAINIPGRQAFFEYWKMPPVGFVALADAQSLEDLPNALNRIRDKFRKLRSSISDIRYQRCKLAEAFDFNTAAGEKAFKELQELDRMLENTFKAFNEEIDTKRSGNRTEMLFNILDYVLKCAGGLGISTLGFLVNKLGLKRRALIQRVPGLLRAASTITNADNLLTLDWINKMFPNTKARKSQNLLLNWAFEHGKNYCLTDFGKVPEEAFVMKVDEENITDRQIWLALFRSDQVTEAFINGTFFE